MDWAEAVSCTGTCPETPKDKFMDNSSGILNPYLQLATPSGWANYMFQTNQGPQFPRKSVQIRRTSAPKAGDEGVG
jgi:hypothetical protein